MHQSLAGLQQSFILNLHHHPGEWSWFINYPVLYWVSALLSASCWLHPHFSLKEQHRGALQLCPCPQRGTWVAEGSPAPGCSTLITLRVQNWSLAGTKQSHTSLCHHPPTRRVWEEGKKAPFDSTVCCSSQSEIFLVMLPCLCLWLCFPAKADCLVKSWNSHCWWLHTHVGKSHPFWLWGMKWLSVARRRKVGGWLTVTRVWLFFLILSVSKYPSITVSFMTSAIPSMNQRRMG